MTPSPPSWARWPALHGKAGIPKRWLANLLGRIGNDDDGRVFQLLDQARSLAWPASRSGTAELGNL
jgi:hypothetical protein